MKQNLIMIFLASVFLSGCDKVYVRKNIYSLPATDPIVIDYQKGVAAMKTRPFTDPTSWDYQANMHGTNEAKLLPLWATCQHGSYYFLSWHRMYLYFFERIVRKACGDPNFALPYWNYSDVPVQASLPEIFRIPANNSNSLYDANRDGSINSGDPLQPSTVEYQNELFDFTFSGSADDVGFGGIVVPAPIHFNGTHGLIESQPHDQVHIDISGDMGRPNTAAKDPIFWLHHCNIDRLWFKWNNYGTNDPTGDANWMNTVFTFYDENGSQVTITGKEVIDIEKQMHYTYDDAPNRIYHPIEVEKPFPWLPNDTSIKKADFLTAANITSAGRQTEFKMETGKTELRSLMNRAFDIVSDSSRKSKDKIMLKLEGITYSDLPNGAFEVYINLPTSEKADFKNIYYAGNIGLFGLMGHGDREMNMAEGGSVLLNITKTISQLKNSHVSLENITVSIIHKGASVRSEQIIKGEIRIKLITLYALQRALK